MTRHLPHWAELEPMAGQNSNMDRKIF